MDYEEFDANEPIYRACQKEIIEALRHSPRDYFELLREMQQKYGVKKRKIESIIEYLQIRGFLSEKSGNDGGRFIGHSKKYRNMKGICGICGSVIEKGEKFGLSSTANANRMICESCC